MPLSYRWRMPVPDGFPISHAMSAQINGGVANVRAEDDNFPACSDVAVKEAR